MCYHVNMSSEIEIKVATNKDSEAIKNLINEMYGFEYETRTNEELSKPIESKDQVFVLVYVENKLIGFAGATTNSEEYLEFSDQTKTVIEYIYVKEDNRDFLCAYKLMKTLLKELTKQGINKAIMQVQTFNKERFLHYALSDKNIIHSYVAKRNNEEYEEQILLIDDIQNCLELTMREYMKKTLIYAKQDNVLN